MDAQRARFVEGCKDVSGIEKAKANELFDLIDKFAGYGFNKSHAAAYALLAYQTAWLKAHYPEEFYAASMCYDMHQSEKLAVFVDDLRRNGLTLLPPDINASRARFSVEPAGDDYGVRYALAGLRNVGEKAMKAVVAEREANGAFESLDDLCRRMPHGAMNRRQLEALGAAGALDALEPNRAKVLANADMLLAAADSAERERQSGQGGLFGGEDHVEPGLRLAECEEWPRSERMAQEREYFGFYFSAHPVEAYRSVASAHGARSYASIMAGGGESGSGEGAARGTATLAVMVEGASIGRTRRGKDFIRADFSDGSGQFSAACFEEGLVENFRTWARDGECVLLTVELDSPSPEEPPRVTVRGARPMKDVSGSLRFVLSMEIRSTDALESLRTLLVPGTGQSEVQARLAVPDGSDPTVRLGRNFAVDGDLADRIGEIEGIANISLKPASGAQRLRQVA
jgi:DNA polymerase-3 subunit alpha